MFGAIFHFIVLEWETVVENIEPRIAPLKKDNKNTFIIVNIDIIITKVNIDIIIILVIRTCRSNQELLAGLAVLYAAVRCQL